MSAWNGEEVQNRLDFEDGEKPSKIEVFDKNGHAVKQSYPNLPAPVRGIIWLAAVCFAAGIFLMALVITGLQAGGKALQGKDE